MAPTGSLNTMGPDGIVAVNAQGVIFDGFTVLNCGLTSGTSSVLAQY